MKLYYSPGACSLSPHIVANEIGIPLELEKVDTKTKQTEHGSDYLAINPKGYVPALRLDDGALLTEGPAIVQYLADQKHGYQTVGDIAYLDDEGYVYICDRKKDMIISGGMNIYPAEIEAALEHHPDVIEVAVFGVPSEEWGESVHAVVVLREGATASEDDIIEFARQHLAHYRVPKSVTFIDELPKTGSGKILKRELRAPFWAGRDSKV